MPDYSRYVQYKLLNGLQSTLDAVITASSVMEESMVKVDEFIVTDMESAPYALSDVAEQVKNLKALVDTIRTVDAQLVQTWTLRLFP